MFTLQVKIFYDQLTQLKMTEFKKKKKKKKKKMKELSFSCC